MRRLRRFIAALAALGLVWSGTGTAIAAYSDVPSNAWYKPAVDRFLGEGYLDESQLRFRGGDNANRAEFVTLLQRVLGERPSPSSTRSFDDVAPGAWYHGAIEAAARAGWVRGDGDCYGSRPCFARPAGTINRAEAAALIVRAMDLAPTGAAPRFPDNPGGTWYAAAIQTAADHCVLQGDTSTRRVRPADSMNRAEMVVMLDRAMRGLEYGDDCRATNPSTAGIDEARATGPRSLEVDFTVDLEPADATREGAYSIRGGSTVGIEDVELISDSAVRIRTNADMAPGERYTLSVQNMRSADGQVFSGSVTFTGYEDTADNGEVTVRLSSSNPQGMTVPRGSQATVVSFDIRATCEADVTVESVKVSHRGFGARSDISGVFAVVGGERRTRIRTLQSGDGTAELRFPRGFVIRACGDETIDIVASFEPDAEPAGEHAFDIALPADVSTSAERVRGEFPLRGNTFRIGTVTSGVVNLAYRTVSPSTTRVGDNDVVVGKFQISANSAENQVLYSITLEQDGSASDGDLQNIRIRRTDGTILTRAAARTTGDFVTLQFDPPFLVRQSERLILEVIADIKGGATETVQFRLAEPMDLLAIGSRYGNANGRTVGSRVVIDPSSSPDIVTIEAGRLTVEIDGPTQRAYTRDDRDAVLANVRFTNDGDPLEIRSMYVAIVAETQTGAGLAVSGDTGADEIREVVGDVVLRNAAGGRSVRAVRLTGPNDSASNAARTYQIYRFDDIDVRGTSQWHLTVDFLNNGSGRHPARGDRFAAVLCTEPTRLQQGATLVANTTGCDFGGVLGSPSTAYQMRVQGVNGDDVGDIRPRGTIRSAFHRISVPELLLAVQDQGASDTTVRGATNVPLLRFEARAGEAKDILLNRLSFEAASGSILNAQNYALWVDTDDDGTVDTILERGVSSRGGTVSFTRLTGGGLLLESEQTRIVEVRADIATSPVSDRLRLRFATGMNNYVEAEEADRGSSLSGIQTDGVCASATPCDILVRTLPGKLWFIGEQGNLYVTLDTTPVRSRQLLGGTTEQVMRLEFRADSEPIVVTDLQITSSGSTANAVERLDLFLEGATTPFASATTGSCGSDDVLTEWQGVAVRTYCAKIGGQRFVIPANQTVDVLVHARVKTDVDGAVSGETVQFFLTGQPVANATTGSGAVRGYGQRSSGQLAANNGDATASGEVFIGGTITQNADVVGRPHDVVLSKITSVVNANPDPNGSNVPVGRAPVGQFRFTSPANANTRNGTNEATLSGVIFTVNASNVEVDTSNFRLYNKENAGSRHDCVAYLPDGTPVAGVAAGTFLVECSGLVAASVNTGVSPGGTLTLVLEADITNPNVQSGTSTLQVSMQNFTSRAAAQAGFGLSASHVHWVDRDQSSTSFYWIDTTETVVPSTSYRS